MGKSRSRPKPAAAPAARNGGRIIAALTARRKAAEYCLFHYPTLYTAGKPVRRATRWEVPVVLASPTHGHLGPVGTLLLDARSGEVVEATERSAVVDAGSRLYKERSDARPATSAAGE